MEFHNPEFFALFILLALAGWLNFRAEKKRAALRFPANSLLQPIYTGVAAKLYWLPTVLVLIAGALMIVAFARPRLPEDNSEIEEEGIDIILALDLSTSMLAADFQPKDRVTVAKQTVAEFIQKRPHDRIGLVVFSGVALTQAPLTLDHRVLIEVLDSLRPGVIVDGTAIGNGLGTALNRLKESNAKTKIVILLTDGDNNAGNIAPMEAAKLAKEMGVKVYTIQVGKGGDVPYPRGKDVFGRDVYIRVNIPVNPALLKQISQETGGEMYVATDSASLEKSFMDILDSLEKSKIEDAPSVRRYYELFAYPLIPAIISLVFGLFLSFTRFASIP